MRGQGPFGSDLEPVKRMEKLVSYVSEGHGDRLRGCGPSMHGGNEWERVQLP
jgi:hypothetical protein